ncbi:MAG: thioredoxin family protein [Sphaerochaetaceae bacterium]|nr:thioredoxin family protein [Sphaerochaetaceae bacterium]
MGTDSKVLIVQYGSKTCPPCHDIRLKIEKWAKEHNVSFRYISTDDHPEEAAQKGILSVPAVVVYVNGHETIHDAGYFSLNAIFERTEYYLSLL